MSLDASAGEMDQQRRHQHVCGCNRIPGRGLSRLNYRQGYRQDAYYASKENCGVNMWMGRAVSAAPGFWRDPIGRNNARDPLTCQESGKKPISMLENALLVPAKQYLSALKDCFVIGLA